MADEMEIDTAPTKGSTAVEKGGKKRFEVKKVRCHLCCSSMAGKCAASMSFRMLTFLLSGTPCRYGRGVIDHRYLHIRVLI